MFNPARIVAPEEANGFVLAALAFAFELYKICKSASVYEHMKEQTQPCQHSRHLARNVEP